VASKAWILRMLNPRRLENGFVVEIESNVGPVDVYRSTDLADWGETPIVTGIAPGLNVVIDPAPPQDRAFYLIVPAGTPPPGG